jgi:hypothetical protein
MDLSLFGDSIITPTDLKTNQKHWFDKAHKSPVSITGRKGRAYVLINREQMQDTFIVKNYAVKIIDYFMEIRNPGKTQQTSVFPWSIHLNESERKEFLNELVASFNESLHGGNWSLLEETIGSWKATAEAITNKKFMKVLAAGEKQQGYTAVE